MSSDVYIGLGANLGDCRKALNSALILATAFSKIISVSRLYHSAPCGFSEQPPFINAAARLSTQLNPNELIGKLQEIEKLLGKKVIRKHGPRGIELDLLLYGNFSLETKRLTIPHPRILDRDFVLLPLLDLNPNLHHPSWGSKKLETAMLDLKECYVDEEPEDWELTV